MTDLGTLGRNEQLGRCDINDNGLIVGCAETGGIYSRRWYYLQRLYTPVRGTDNVIYDLGVHNDFYTYAFVLPYSLQ